ncbi:MAG: type II toxin-antitoxin system VapC family toxin [Proteobacteria bacterium]|nr:type II toxin-antitoxin system VapC family toxin [Pseudomonadota bacterium]
MIVLDTHAWIWVVAGDRTLSGEARSAIEEAAAAGAVLVPAIAVWELAMLEARGRITLAKPCPEWVDDALAAPGFALAPLSPDVAVESVRLPQPFHDDPADRLIVATARVAGAALVTRDRRILDYGARGHLRVIRA